MGGRCVAVACPYSIALRQGETKSARGVQCGWTCCCSRPCCIFRGRRNRLLCVSQTTNVQCRSRTSCIRESGRSPGACRLCGFYACGTGLRWRDSRPAKTQASMALCCCKRIVVLSRPPPRHTFGGCILGGLQRESPRALSPLVHPPGLRHGAAKDPRLLFLSTTKKNSKFAKPLGLILDPRVSVGCVRGRVRPCVGSGKHAVSLQRRRQHEGGQGTLPAGRPAPFSARGHMGHVLASRGRRTQ